MGSSTPRLAVRAAGAAAHVRGRESQARTASTWKDWLSMAGMVLGSHVVWTPLTTALKPG